MKTKGIVFSYGRDSETAAKSATLAELTIMS